MNKNSSKIIEALTFLAVKHAYDNGLPRYVDFKLNADDEAVAKMAELSDGEVIFFSKHGLNSITKDHLAKGGKAVFIENDTIVLSQGQDQDRLIRTSSIPLLQSSSKANTLESVLAAVAAVWALNTPKDIIATGLQTYN